MFILTEPTPNPDAMKFIPHAQLTDGAAWAFVREGFEPRQSPLAARLFELADVSAVYVAAEFVTVTRSAQGQAWRTLRIQAIAAIADHLDSGAPAVAAGALPAEAPEGESRIETEIRAVLDLHVRPGVARDGGDVLFDRFDLRSGVLWIRMQGACGGCPSSRLTLKAGVERIIQRYVPEVASVEETVSERASPAATSIRVKDWLARFGDRRGPPQRTVFTRAGKPVARGQAGGDRQVSP